MLPRRAFLTALYVAAPLIAISGAAVAIPHLPSEMAILFSIEREPISTLPAGWVVGFLSLVAIVGSVAGLRGGRQSTPPSRLLGLTAATSWAAAASLTCLLAVHHGVEAVQLVTGPGAWLAVPAGRTVAAGRTAEWLSRQARAVSPDSSV